MRHVFIVILAAMAAPLAAQQARALEFKGVPLGSPPDALRLVVLEDREAKTWQCHKRRDQADVSDCIVDAMSYANERTKRVVATYKNDALEAVLVEGPFQAFDGTVAALQEKYGKPSQLTRSKVQNRAGGVFDQAIYQWRIGGGLIVAKRYDADVSTFSVTIASREHLDRTATEQAKKPAKKDI